MVRVEMFAETTRAALRSAVLAYFDTHKRDLPWRREPDAYRVWLSEIVLQQTRVDTVLGYYNAS